MMRSGAYCQFPLKIGVELMCHRGVSCLVRRAVTGALMAAALLPAWSGSSIAAPQSTQPQQSGESTELPPADLLLQQAIDAMGGKEALERITSRESRGYMQTPNGEVTLMILSADAGKFLIRQTFGGRNEFVFGSDGSTLWTRDPAGNYRLLNPAQASQVRQFDCLSVVDDLMMRYPTRQTVARESIDEHDVYRIKLTGKDPSDQFDMLVDADSKLVRGKEYNKVAGAGGIVRMRFIFDDWKQFDDVKLFTKVAVQGGEQSAGSMTFTDIRHNSVEASTFDLPAEVQKLLEKPAAPAGEPPPPPGSR
jgi:hypothetical protein